MKFPKFIPRRLYRWKRGRASIEEKELKHYSFLRAADYNNGSVGDCWPVNNFGDVCPGYNSPIPVSIDDVVLVVWAGG